MDVEGLGLVDEGRPSQGQVDDFLLADFPDCLEDVPSFFGDLLHTLDGPVRSNQLVPHLRSPQILHSRLFTFEIKYSTRFLLTQTNSPARTLRV